jgi:hypothetical protein
MKHVKDLYRFDNFGGREKQRRGVPSTSPLFVETVSSALS